MKVNLKLNLKQNEIIIPGKSKGDSSKIKVKEKSWEDPKSCETKPNGSSLTDLSYDLMNIHTFTEDDLNETIISGKLSKGELNES